ncbi:putative ribonuclease H-like domain-containing protein [Tanacetum coccineum]|uniref:Ribonuclease H-like domain-containing protein n=1 Tax=Tanacetum coccineum TaxID=301880 RepID=A0ABQ4X3M9_9ASTR
MNHRSKGHQDQEKDDNVNSTNTVNAASINEVNAVGAKTSIELPDDPNMPKLEDIIYSDDDEDVGVEADMNNLDAFIPVSPILTTRIHKDHPVEQIVRDLNSAPQTKRMIKNLEEHGLFSFVQQRTNHKDFQNCLFACFLSQEEPKKMDVKSAFLYGKIEEEVYVCQSPGFEDPDFPDRVYKVEKALYDASSLELGLQVKQKKDGIFISQDKYATEILNKFGFTDVKIASTSMETQKPLLKDEDGEKVNVHLYKSIIGSLMYLTFSRPDIMFIVCACARYQVNPKISHLHAVKRIFRYLKGQPKLDIWYPKHSPFDLVAYTDGDYAGASLDMKSTIGGCQFLGSRLISWQCKKQTVVANSIIEAEFVAASSCYRQVLWIQNQLLDYGYNFLHTKIFIDNNSTICIIKNPIFHSKTKHIEIRHHFIRDCNEKKLIQMVKIHTEKNVADLLIKAFENGIGVNAGDSKLMLLGINLLLLRNVNAARHKLTAAEEKDAEGVDCLLNATIFKELTRMGYEKLSQKLTFYKAFFSPQWKFLIHTILQCLSAKTTAWNEFSSTMASVIICLATNQKFNFSKYIFENMVKNLDNAGKFLMYPRGNINKTQSKATPNEPSSPGTSSGGGPRRQETIRDTIALTRVLDLENTKTAQAQEITSLKLRIKKRSILKQRRKIDDIDKDAEITLVDETHGRYGDDIMFDVSDLAGEEVFVAEQGVPDSKKDDVAQVNTAAITVSTASTILVSATLINDVEITLAQALAELKSAKPTTTTSTRPKAKGLVIHE